MADLYIDAIPPPYRDLLPIISLYLSKKQKKETESFQWSLTEHYAIIVI